MELLSCPSTASIEIEALSFQALEFWAHFYKHWNSPLIVPNTGIPPYFNLYTLAFLSYPSKRRNFSPTFIHIDFFYLILQNLGILPLFSLSDIRILRYFYKHSNTYFLLPNPGMFWPFFIHFFSYAILLNIAILILSL